MDYLNFERERHHRIVLLAGYVLVAIAIFFASIILVYLSYGFGIAKNGAVIQNGLVFFSSQPNSATIFVNTIEAKSKTNTRLMLPGGVYHIKLTRNGYRDWQRVIELNGGSVLHFDYPLLIPTTLNTKPVHDYAAALGVFSQSPDKRWLVVSQPGSMTNFDLYDTKAITTPATVLTLPSALLTNATSSQSWQVVDWADDNQHLLLQHLYDGKSEYILLDRSNPASSINLNTTFNVSPSKVSFNNRKYDQYYLYDSVSQTLQTATLKSPTPVTVQQHVLNYQSYGDNMLLYATDSDTPSGKVIVRLVNGDHTYLIHTFDSGATYLLNLTTYNGTLYAAVGSAAESKVYIYRDPIGQLTAQPTHVVTPIEVLHITTPNYLNFSANAQFIGVESGNQFAVYDIQNDMAFNYTVRAPLDAPQQHASWMDGDRLTYVSNGKLEIVDYDGKNPQALNTANANYVPAFSASYHDLYDLTPLTSNGTTSLTVTSLLTPADQ